ncbi:Microsomal Glutathione S-transferase [Globisporangium polare]
MVKIVLLPGHGYIPLLAVGTTFVNFWAAMQVGKARKKYNILYPQMYAEKSDKNAKDFNCVQRAHQNILEQLPVFFTLLFTSSAFRPGIAAIAGVVRIAGFIVYVRGYASGDPKKRMQGNFGYLGLLVSLGLSIEAGLRITGAI